MCTSVPIFAEPFEQPALDRVDEIPRRSPKRHEAAGVR
jgi:hypothetical protein